MEDKIRSYRADDVENNSFEIRVNSNGMEDSSENIKMELTQNWLLGK